jgi:AcrR family transcriptional regulator
MDRSEKEKMILSASLKLFAQYGYKKTTIEDVARELGMTPGSIYFYVKSKKDLYEKAVRNALDSWRESVASAVSGETDAVDKFRVMAEQSFRYLRDRDDILAILSRDSDIFTITPGEDRFSDINREAMGLMRSILEQGVREKMFHAMNVELMTDFLFSTYMMMLIKAYVKPEGDNVDAMFREGLNLILKGLTK